jgi:hypothetical protein
MKTMLCKFQETVFASNLGIKVSRCGNDNCRLFVQVLAPELCETCPLRVLPDEAQIADWLLHFNGSESEGPERTQAEIDYFFKTYCAKCAKYNEKEKLCAVCDCPGSNIPVRERMRLEHFHCPLKLW